MRKRRLGLSSRDKLLIQINRTGSAAKDEKTAVGSIEQGQIINTN
jgi:hypothetical protein